MIDIQDLIASGRLPLLAAGLGVDMGNALLVLTFVYSDTQDAGFSDITQMQLRSLVRSKLAVYCPAVAVDTVLPAMVEAGLAEETHPGLWVITGNAKRIEALAKYHGFKVDAGRKGGLTKAAAQAEKVIDVALTEIKQEKTEQIRIANASKPKQTLANASAVAVAVAVDPYGAIEPGG